MEQNQPNKKCSKCGENGPFGKDKRHKDGLQSRCKNCDREAKHLLRQKQPDIEREKLYKWRKKNPDKFNQHLYKYRQSHLEQEKINHAIYYREHRQDIINKTKQYQIEHPEVYRNSNRNYRARKAKAKGSFSKIEWLELCGLYDNRCAYCNQKIVALQPDHIIPLVRGGSNDIENIVPACKSCNTSKQDTPLLVWLHNRIQLP